MARIVVCGYMIRHPVAGLALAYFHYVLGLHRLGHEVAYLEESGWNGSCYDPISASYSDDPTHGMRMARALARGQGIDIPMAYVNRESGATYGAEWGAIKSMLRQADLLINVGGVCWLPEFSICRRTALIDMDPFFTQIGRFAGESLHLHQVHFSYGTHIGIRGCSIPTAGVDWIPTVPPVVIDLWRSHRAACFPGAAFTTVAHWSAYGSVSWRGQRYGQKDEEFLRIIDLPGRTEQSLELAVSGIGRSEQRRFREAGWALRDAAEISTDPVAYATYVARSRGEFSVAKHAYVKTRSGWFSDRSVCYLAAGRPVILQDTGFSDWLPTGRGVLAFSSEEEAVRSIERVAADYPAQRREATRIAQRYFGHDVVLPPLVKFALGGKRTERSA